MGLGSIEISANQTDAGSPPTSVAISRLGARGLESRTKIARDYCRVIAVIDDQVFEHDGRTMEPRFYHLQQESQQHDILCGFLHYKGHDCDADAEELERAVRSARAADVVVLDWKMGNPEQRKSEVGLDLGDESHALSIIRKLAEDHALRFVVIYTRESADSVEEELQRGLKESCELCELTGSNKPIAEPATPDDFVTGKEKEAPTPSRSRIYHWQNRLFITVRQCNGDKSVSPRELIELIPSILLDAFTDHLHWAGLEVAARTKRMLPQIIADLPAMTDGGILHQLLYQQDNEIAEQITEVLLDELEFRFQVSPLETVSDVVLFDHLKSTMQRLCANKEILTSIVEKLSPSWIEGRDIARSKNLLKTTPTAMDKRRADVVKHLESLSWINVDLQACRSALAGDKAVKVVKYFPHDPEPDPGDPCRAASEYIKTALQLDGQNTKFDAWVGLRESVVSTVNKNQLWPGYVLRRANPAQGQSEWLLCITPACDCAHPKDGNYLFVEGKKRTGSPQASEARETQTFVRDHEIIWNAQSLVVLHKPLERIKVMVEQTDPLANVQLVVEAVGAVEETLTGVDEFEVYGCLRPKFTERIIQRIWSYQSRVGVDSSEIYRQVRKER